MAGKRTFKRASRDEYYLRIAYDVAARSTCTRRQIGAVIVAGDVIVSTGYNGNPRGMPHCDEIGCIRDELGIPSGERMEICTGVHAEMNALVFAGPASRSGTLYCTIVPCNTCAKMIINAGVKRVVYSEGYPDALGYEILKHSEIQVDRLQLAGSKPRTLTTAAVPGGRKRKSVTGETRNVDRMKEALREKFASITSPAAESLSSRAAKKLRQKMRQVPRKAG